MKTTILALGLNWIAVRTERARDGSTQLSVSGTVTAVKEIRSRSMAELPDQRKEQLLERACECSCRGQGLGCVYPREHHSGRDPTSRQVTTQ